MIRKDFAPVIAWSAGRLDAKPMMPIRAGLLLDARDDQVTITGVSDEGSTRVTLAADVLEPGRTVVAGRMLGSVLDTYRGDQVELTDGEQVTLRCENSEFRIGALDPRDYPAPAPIPVPSGTVDGGEFAAAVRQVASATSPNGTAGPWQGAVQLEGGPGRLELWATDGYRISQADIPWSTPEESRPVGALVSVTTLLDAVKAMEGGVVELGLGGGSAGIGGGGLYVAARTVDPHGRKDVRGLIPRLESCVLVVDVEVAPLVAAVKRACLVAGDRKPKVLLGVGEASVSVRAAGDDTGAVSLDSMPAVLQGDGGMQVAFQPAYLLHALQSIDGDRVRVGLTHQYKPVLFTAAGDEAAYRHAAMPVRL
jgi:DNA polymerase-3 subunit beta